MNSIDPNIDFHLLSLLSPEQAHAFEVVPFQEQEQELSLYAMSGQHPQAAELGLILGRSLTFHSLPKEQLQQVLLQCYPYESKSREGQARNLSEADSDIVRFVQDLFADAAHMGASDIHLERYEHDARIRFRWEGQLVEKYDLPLPQYNAIVSRIKILAELDIAERRLPQDGRINFQHEEQEMDMRVSTLPGKFGERVVLRLLTRSDEQLQLSRLGFESTALENYQDAIQRPNGIILITGPTGSGKTTTLYATLNQLNQPDRNILTIEDPIEYNLRGINQVQLKEEIGLSFDRALRAFLRQDPDIIMVGEIRDEATARIAIRSALTGHLVFSTLHTNSAWDAVSRLQDMGMEPYLLAASLRLLMAQRLVRRLCPDCKTQSQEILAPKWQERHQIDEHWLPAGCSNCYYTGYRGREAIFEVLPIGEELAEAIKSAQHNSTPAALSRFQSLDQSLAKKVQQGLTSLAEALRLGSNY